MNRKWRVVYLGLLVSALAVALGVWKPLKPAKAKGGSAAPRYRVDPSWPKPLPVEATQINPATGKPKPWVTGEVAGTCTDSRDHVFTVNRGNLISPETVTAVASPPVLEYDREGNIVNAWGNRNVLPNGLHGCFVDFQDNVWIAGNGDGIVQKYAHNGNGPLLQIGTRGVCDNPPANTCGNSAANPAANQSKTLLNQPPDMAIDPSNGDIYVADGYGNHRVVVFDKNGVYLRQWGNSGLGPGQFQPADGGHPHAIAISKDGLVYATDRGSDRVQVFEKNPTNCAGTGGNRVCQPVQIIPIKPGTGNFPNPFGVPALGTAGSAWDVDFSVDGAQTFLFDTDGGNEILWTLNRRSGSILSGFGRPGHQSGEFTFLHTLALDSKGNLFTGETINGRRIQKFVRADDDDDD